jgi:heptosyltransferase III
MTDARPTLLIYRLGSLGDTVVALPCFHKVAEAFPDHRRVVVTNAPVSEVAPSLGNVLLGSGLIDGCIYYPLRMRSPGAIHRVMSEIRQTGAKDLVYIGGGRGLAKVYRDAAFFRLCGIKRLIGVPWTLRDEHVLVDPETGETEFEGDRLARCLRELGPIDVRDPALWDLGLSNDEKAEAARFVGEAGLDKFLAVHMGGKIAEKDWGEEAWIALLDALSERLPDHGLVIVGAAADRARAETAKQRWPGRPAVNACGEFSPRVTAAVLQRASLFVGHDSGPLHLAAATRTKAVGLFGVINRPRQWHPPFSWVAPIHDIRGVEFIRVEQVLDAVDSLRSRDGGA